jgi:hypothetical protein
MSALPAADGSIPAQREVRFASQPEILGGSSVQAPNPPRNYLNRDVALNPHFTADPQQISDSHSFYSQMWKAGSIALLIFYIIAATAIMIALSFVAPIYIPIVAVLAFTLAPMALKVYEIMRQHSSDCDLIASREKCVAEELEFLKAQPEEKLREILANAGFADRISNYEISVLQPVLARHEFYGHRIKACTDKIAKIKDRLPELQNDPAKREELNAARREILLHEGDRRQARVSQAYMTVVLRNPNMTHMLEDICTFNRASIEERALNRAFDDAQGDLFVTFKNAAGPVTMNEERVDGVEMDFLTNLIDVTSRNLLVEPKKDN